MATRATPGAISRNRGRMVPVYGTIRESRRPNSHRPPGSGESRDHAFRSARPGERDRCVMLHRDEEGSPICERARRTTSALARCVWTSHLLASADCAPRTYVAARHPNQEVAHEPSYFLVSPGGPWC